ncbi:MAG: hypothetical protein AB7V39_07900 [Nitrospiraceae bacterium]
MINKNHAARQMLQELIKRVRLVVDFKTSRLEDGRYEVRSFHSDGVHVDLDAEGTITTKVDNPIMLLLNPNYALTPVDIIRADGYQPLARTEHLAEVLAIMRSLPPPASP